MGGRPRQELAGSDSVGSEVKGTIGARPPLHCREDDVMHNHPSHFLDSPREIAARYRSRAAATRRRAKRKLSIAETYEHIAENIERVEGKRSSAPSNKPSW